jgi:carboxypeptidase family protein
MTGDSRDSLQMAAALYGHCGARFSSPSSNSTITGRVTDPANAVINGANVSAINVDTNVGYRTMTNAVGQFTMPTLVPGTYTLEIAKTGTSVNKSIPSFIPAPKTRDKGMSRCVNCVDSKWLL